MMFNSEEMRKRLETFFKKGDQSSLEEIIKIYEEDLFEKGDFKFDLGIDLLVLYFEVSDPGFAAHYGLNLEFINSCSENFHKLLELMQRRFPNSLELAFWQNYMMFILYGTPPFEEVSEKFANQDETLVPFFHFYDETSGKYEIEARALYQKIMKNRSFKDNYIHSVLHARFERVGR